MRWKGGLVNDV